MTNCVRAALVLLACAVACHSQETGLYTFFKQNIGLNDSEIAGIEHGKAVAKVLDSPTPSQVFVFVFDIAFSETWETSRPSPGFAVPVFPTTKMLLDFP